MSLIGDFFARLGSKLGSSSEYNKTFVERIPENQPIYNYEKENDVLELMQNALLYTVVNKIATIAANVPFRLVRLKSTGEKDQIFTDEIILRWQYPNKYEGGIEFRKKLSQFYLTTGNAYMLASRTMNDQIQNWQILPSQHTQIISGDWRDPVKGYITDVQQGEGRRFNADDVIHWKMPNLNYTDAYDQAYGMSPQKPLKEILKSSRQALTRKINDFELGGLKGIITVKDGDTIVEPEQMQALIKTITTSTKRVGGISVPVDFLDTNVALADMQVLESLKSDFEAICSAYGINPGLFSGDTTFENQRMYMRAMYTQVIMPMLYSLYDILNIKWVKSINAKYLLEPDFSNVKELEEDNLMRIQYLNQARGIITINEARAYLELPKIDDPKGDEIFVDLGQTPLEDFNLPPSERNPMGTMSRSTVNDSLQSRLNNDENNDET